MTPKRHKVKYPDITKPVPVPEIKEHAVPLPEDHKKQQRRWDWYMQKPRWRDYVKKERQA